MSHSEIGMRLRQVINALAAGGSRALRRPKVRRSVQFEYLEGRQLLTGITATGVISSAPTGANFDYTIKLTNASISTASIGTFWYAWVPGEDFLATNPISVTPPAGWTDIITHSTSSPPDGYAIQFVAKAASDNVQAGSSLTFSFVSADTPVSVNGNSVDYPSTPVGTSFVYSEGPFQGISEQFDVTPAPTLQSIAVTPANTSLAAGMTEQFTATGTLSDNTTENLTSQVTWSSSDTTWATVNPVGLATAVGPGPVTISAALDGVTGSTGLTVTPAVLESIAVTPANTSLPVGKTEQLTATGTLSDNTTEDLTSQVTWSSSDTTWATVSAAGLATAVGQGPVTISAAFDGITGSTGLTVTSAILESIAVTPANTSLAAGMTEQFTAIGTLSDNTTENLTSQVTWSSSDATWATVSAAGLAMAVAPGPVTISAALDGITGSTGLTATPAVLESIAVTPANTSLAVGKTEQFAATGTLSNNTTEDLTSQVTWSSSDTTWATIDTSGLATAVGVGPVTISAALDGITGSTDLTVTPAPTLQSIAVTPANTSLVVGNTEQFTATGTLSDNTTENLTSQVTWSSSDTTWATINASGLATAVGQGPVTISAAFDGITGSTDLTVEAAPTLQSITVTPANTSLAAGMTEQFTAIGTLSDNTTENLTSQVTWSSSDTTWATINAAGMATAVSPGPVTISATFDGITGSTGLTVNPSALSPPTTTPTTTVIVGQQPLLVRSLKHGKPVGKPMLSGFALDFGIPLNAASASNAANFQVDTVSTKRVKKKVVTTLHRINKFTVSYDAVTNAIDIKLGLKQTFPTGGQITLLGGTITATGGTLTGPAVFTIAKGGKRITPA